jgi:hypothetical protein
MGHGKRKVVIFKYIKDSTRWKLEEVQVELLKKMHDTHLEQIIGDLNE